MVEPPGRLFEDPEHWRKRAAEMRALAAEMVDTIAKQKLVDAAEEYERLALRAAARVQRRTGDQPSSLSDES